MTRLGGPMTTFNYDIVAELFSHQERCGAISRQEFEGASARR